LVFFLGLDLNLGVIDGQEKVTGLHLHLDPADSSENIEDFALHLSSIEHRDDNGVSNVDWFERFHIASSAKRINYSLKCVDGTGVLRGLTRVCFQHEISANLVLPGCFLGAFDPLGLGFVPAENRFIRFIELLQRL
jgi:hypothetical protein